MNDAPVRDLSLTALQRLDRFLASEYKLFTSDLTVNEFACTTDAGFRPISQVMGGSVYHVGRQKYYEWMSNCELELPTRALNDVRRRALQRLSHEAEHVHADAVVGVHMTTKYVGWTSHVVECTVVGTAVRMDVGRGDNNHAPILTNLSGQDFWKLHCAGYEPAGICAGSSVYTATSPWKLEKMGTRGVRTMNQELDLFTQAQQDARRLASGRAYSQALSLNAGGIVGVEIERDAEAEGRTRGRLPERITFHFTVIGTAVVGASTVPQSPSALAVMNLNSPNKNGETP